MVCGMICGMSIKKYLSKLEDMSDKEVLVTGGTSGIGLSLVRQLLSKNATVIVLSRNLEKWEGVKASLLKEFEHAKLSFIKYDQSNDESVKVAANEVAKKHPHFDALVLNAGVMQRKKPTKYIDDYSMTIKTNFIGLSLFLDALLPQLEGKHRFIFQGSLAAGFHFKKIQTLKEKKISLWQQYALSKAGVEALYYHYAQSELPHEFILVEPGIAITGIVRDFNPVIRFLARMVSFIISHTADKAALTAMKALQTTTPNKSYIVPRGPFTYRGYPKFKKFPKKRIREYLITMLKDY